MIHNPQVGDYIVPIRDLGTFANTAIDRGNKLSWYRGVGYKVLEVLPDNRGLRAEYAGDSDSLRVDVDEFHLFTHKRRHPAGMPSIDYEKADRKMAQRNLVAKPTNPKDAVGIRKAPYSTVPTLVMNEVGVAMLEGARKYGRHNYRVDGVRTSVYHDAAMRHLGDFYEGLDIDPESGIHNVTKAIACLVIVRDAIMNDKLVDDRPPKTKNIAEQRETLNKLAAQIIDRIPDAKPAHTEIK